MPAGNPQAYVEQGMDPAAAAQLAAAQTPPAQQFFMAEDTIRPRQTAADFFQPGVVKEMLGPMWSRRLGEQPAGAPLLRDVVEKSLPTPGKPKRGETAEAALPKGLPNMPVEPPAFAYPPAIARGGFTYEQPPAEGPDPEVGPRTRPLFIPGKQISVAEHQAKPEVQAQMREFERQVKQQRKVMGIAQKLYKEGGRDELRSKAFIFEPAEAAGAMPKSLRKKVETGEVIPGTMLPPWLLKQAPQMKKLYWYRKDLSPQMQALMQALTTDEKQARSREDSI